MPDTSDDLTITRSELIKIVDQSSEGCTQSTRDKLHRVAETTDAVAVGWFHCDGVGCPMRQTGYRRNQKFQQAFDTTMAALYDAQPTDEDFEIEPFVVEVVDD